MEEQPLGGELEQLADPVTVKRERHRPHNDAVLKRQLLPVTGRQAPLQLCVLLQPSCDHVGQHHRRILMVAGERQILNLMICHLQLEWKY